MLLISLLSAASYAQNKNYKQEEKDIDIDENLRKMFTELAVKTYKCLKGDIETCDDISLSSLVLSEITTEASCKIKKSNMCEASKKLKEVYNAYMKIDISVKSIILYYAQCI